MKRARHSVLPGALALGLLFARVPAATAEDAPASERKNSIFGELLGAGWGATLNYERELTSRVSARIGGGLAMDGKPGVVPSIGAPPVPEDLSLFAASDVRLLGQKHQLIAGAGVRVLWIRWGYTPTETHFNVFGETGYRYSASSGFLLKATFAVTSREWVDEYGHTMLPVNVGVSLGWSF